MGSTLKDEFRDGEERSENRACDCIRSAGRLDAQVVATLTIKKFSETLLARPKEKASASRRSVTLELLSRLEASLAESTAPQRQSEAQRQSDAWDALSGKWKSDLTVQDEVAQLYKARTRGREG